MKISLRLKHYAQTAKETFAKAKDITTLILKRYTQSWIWTWCWYFFWTLILIISLISGLKKSAKGLPDSSYIIIMVIIVSIVRKVRPRLIKRWPYFQEKPSAPYIMLFMILLLSCAFLLMVKLEPVAEQIANIAYFLLVVGVGIEFYQLIKQGKVKNDTPPEGQATENTEKDR